MFNFQKPKNTLKHLEEENELLKKYLNIAGVIIVHLNRAGEVIYINKSGCEILGYEKKEILGKSWFDNFLPENQIKNVKETSFNKLFEGRVDLVEYFRNPVKTKSGNEKIILWHNTVARDSSGKVTGIISSGGDITEIAIAENNLLLSEKKYREFFDSAADLIVIIDPTGKLFDVNKLFETESGYSREEVLGKNIFTSGILSAQSVIKASSVLKDLLFGNPWPIFEVEGITKDGNKVPYELRAVPLKEDGKIKYVQAILRNITQRKIIDQEREKHLKEVEIFYKTATERELRIIELKEKVRDLEGKLNKR